MWNWLALRIEICANRTLLFNPHLHFPNKLKKLTELCDVVVSTPASYWRWSDSWSWNRLTWCFTIFPVHIFISYYHLLPNVLHTYYSRLFSHLIRRYMTSAADTVSQKLKGPVCLNSDLSYTQNQVQVTQRNAKLSNSHRLAQLWTVWYSLLWRRVIL
jgi:hypothetical protein